METAQLLGRAIVEAIRADPLPYTAIALVTLALWWLWPRLRRRPTGIDPGYVAWLERKAELSEQALHYYATAELYQRIGGGYPILADSGKTAVMALNHPDLAPASEVV